MRDLLNTKERLHALCQERLEKRAQSIRTALDEAQTAANEETKSSAGDKHETGRAMMQLETEKLGGQLREVLREQEKLHRIRHDTHCRVVEPGALVITDSLQLYFTVSAGKLVLDGEEYFALSAQTPLGKVALGKKEGDRFALQKKQYLIRKII